MPAKTQPLHFVIEPDSSLSDALMYSIHSQIPTICRSFNSIETIPMRQRTAVNTITTNILMRVGSSLKSRFPHKRLIRRGQQSHDSPGGRSAATRRIHGRTRNYRTINHFANLNGEALTRRRYQAADLALSRRIWYHKMTNYLGMYCVTILARIFLTSSETRNLIGVTESRVITKYADPAPSDRKEE